MFGTKKRPVDARPAVLRYLSGLGPEEGLDKDDNKFGLSFFAVRLFWGRMMTEPVVDQFNNLSPGHSVPRVEDMTEQVRSVLNETGNLSILGQAESSLGWLSVASTYAALMEVEMSDDDIVMDGPRCLATVECTFAAFQAGMLLLSSSGWGSAAEYGDEDQAGAIARMVGLLELQCQQLCKRVAPMANNGISRRVDYNLICYRQQYRFMKERASRLSGIGERDSIQGGMDQFVTRRSKNEAASPVGG
jgi:hypothetical protein